MKRLLISPPDTHPEVGERSKTRRRTAVSFSTVEIYSHSPKLAGDKVPSEGPSVGLGKLKGVALRKVDSYEASRAEERTGVNFIEPEERRNLVSISRQESIDEIELEAERDGKRL